MPHMPSFESLFRQSPNAYVLLSPDLVILDASDAYLRVTARSRANLVGRFVTDAFPAGSDNPDGERELLSSLHRVLAHKVVDALPVISYAVQDERGEHPAGERYWSATHTPILDVQGEVQAILQHTADVTELHAAPVRELALAGQPMRQLEEGVLSRVRLLQNEGYLLRRLFEQAPGFVAFLRGPEHVFELANAAYVRLVGDRALIGRPLREALPEVVRQGFLDRLNHCYATGEPFIGNMVPVRLRRSEGASMEEVFVDFIYQPIIEADGAVSGIFVQGQDVTAQKRVGDELARHRQHLELLVEERTLALEQSERERRQAERALGQLQRLEAIGKVAGSIAHDFNNVLQIVGGNLQLVRRQVGDNDKLLRRLDAANDGLEKGSRLASQMLAFARRQPLAPKPVDLGQLIAHMKDLLAHALGETVVVDLDVEEGLWVAYADPHRLESVVLNLAINAREAMNDSGRVCLRLRNLSLAADTAAAPSGLQGDYVQLSVIDQGAGMASEVVERAFEPFFTTKAEGAATGLGLSMVYGVVKQSGGHVVIDSHEGHGTSVVVYLPRHLEAASAESQDEALSAQGETVLVVEDDADVRATMAAMLGDLGYRVLQSEDGDRALASLRSGMQIDLLLSDVVLPGATGSRELAQEARSLLPGLPVLYMSGYPASVIASAGRLEPDAELMAKPCGSHDLAVRVRHLLEARPTIPGGLHDAAAVADTTVAEGLRVLLVEDDATLRMLTEEVIAELGHRVTACESGEDALPLIDAQTFDVLFTDVGLCGMSGIDLVRRARERVPALAVVIASGYPIDAREHGLTDVRMLLKPYDVMAVRDMLESLADAMAPA